MANRGKPVDLYNSNPMTPLILIAIIFLVLMFEIRYIYRMELRKKPPEIKEYKHEEEKNPAINRSTLDS